MRTIAIAGVGLIGGSFALALRKAGFQGRIVGVSSPETLRRALARGVVDEGLPLRDAVADADLVYLAQPIRGILETLPLLDESIHPGALVTDAGSTKADIVRRAAETLTRCQFVGGHPLAGKESRGVDAADADLFQGRPYVLTPAPDSEPLAQFKDWLRRIGSIPVIMDAATHDQTVALTSHLPQVASTALASMLSSQGEHVRRIFGPALLDSTRLALSPIEIWADILSTNRHFIGTALDSYIVALQQMRERLTTGDFEPYFSRGAGFAADLRRAPN